MNSDIIRHLYMVGKVIVIILGIFFLVNSFVPTQIASEKKPLWGFQAIDTMKYSRDLAREKLSDTPFDLVIDRQISNIAGTGATHVAVATPYDEEFYPFLKRWVESARKHNLKIWFRGNFSGWEGWFEYPKIDRNTHIAKTREFILTHPEIFENGDVFSACPECENGGHGDPRHNGDAAGHKQFLIDEYKVTKEAFEKIGKDVKSNYHSMNGDVARLIMDEETTRALDGIIVVDHYVKTPEQLASDIKAYSKNGSFDVVLGEYGAPIPDIHGNLSEEEQAKWLDGAYRKLIMTPELYGLSYWTNVGGTTELWDGSGNPRKAVEVLRSYYMPEYQAVIIKNEIGQTLRQSTIKTINRTYEGDESTIMIPRVFENQEIEVSHNGYETEKIMLSGKADGLTIVLQKEHEDFWFQVQKILRFLLFRP